MSRGLLGTILRLDRVAMSRRMMSLVVGIGLSAGAMGSLFNVGASAGVTTLGSWSVWLGVVGRTTLGSV